MTAKRRALIICVIIAMYLLVGFIESKANNKNYFENNYSYAIRNKCRPLGYTYGFHYSILCANNLIQQQKNEELRLETLELIRSQIELNKELSDKLDDCRRIRKK